MTTQNEPASPSNNGDSKSDQVRALLQTGVAAGQIAKEVGCSRNLVYIIKNSGVDGGKRTERKATPRPVADVDAAVHQIVQAIRENELQTEALRDGLMRIKDIVDGLLR